MQIHIDTSLPLNNLERDLLSLLLGRDAKSEPETAAVVQERTAPKATAAAKKAAAKKAEPEPEPDPEPEPMAEEPLEDEPEPDEEPDDETSDEDLLALAVKKATEMVAGGEAAQVREALDAAGASRVRELNANNVREFFKALG